MRSAFLLSVFSFALLSLFGWARHEPHLSVDAELETISGEDEVLFVG